MEKGQVKINAGQSVIEQTKKAKAKKRWQKPKLEDVFDCRVSLNSVADYVIQRTF